MRFELTRALEVLERTPATLRALLGGLPAEWTTPNEGGDTFSARDNVAHLVHAERTNWPVRAQAILEQTGERRFAPFDPFGFRAARGEATLEELLAEFERLRAANLTLVRGWRLSERELALTGEHPVFGTVTLEELLATWVAHDLGHIAQTARVLAKQYGAAVGPWRAYLPILTRGADGRRSA